MDKKFYINSEDGYIDMLEQYRKKYEELGNPRFLPNHSRLDGIVYDIKPEYGKGTIQVFKLLGDVNLLIYDIIFYCDIITIFDLSEEYFELEYCIDGSMHIFEEKTGDTYFETNDLSVSLSENMKGTIKHLANQKYQGVSITANKNNLFNYFGSSGIDVWNETIEMLERQFRYEYYLGQIASPEIANIFIQIFNCRLPVKSRSMFYESKVMEVLSLIVSDEVAKQENFKIIALSPYELRKIKEIPQMLLNNPFELPTVSELSKKLVINQKKLTKGFKLVYGDTIFSYHRKLSLERAASMLLNTERTINEIAYDMGYSNSSNFCVAFKKEYGITPLKYRESSILRNEK